MHELYSSNALYSASHLQGLFFLQLFLIPETAVISIHSYPGITYKSDAYTKGKEYLIKFVDTAHEFIRLFSLKLFLTYMYVYLYFCVYGCINVYFMCVIYFCMSICCSVFVFISNINTSFAN